MKTTSKLVIVVASLIVAYHVALVIYAWNISGELMTKLSPVSMERYCGALTLDTVPLPAKPILVVDTVGTSSGASEGFIEMLRPVSPAMNHKLVLYTDFARKIQHTTRGDTLFLTVKAGNKGFDLKYYSDDLQGVICHSNQRVSLVGIRVPRFYVQACVEKVGIYDSCQIGCLATTSNRFLFVNAGVIEELSAVDGVSFRNKLSQGSQVLSHSYYKKK